MRSHVSVAGLACATLLSACGGGGGGSSSGASTAATGSKFQSVDFGFPGTRYLATDPAPLVATTSSGLTITFSSNTPDVCKVTDGKLVPVKPGECSITASQAGDATYAPASSQQLFKVLQKPQTITFESPGFQAINSQPAPLAATATSGLPVAYTSTTPAVCTTSGTTLTLVSKGQCGLTANQEGDVNYAPAPPQMVAFTVGDAPPPVLTFLSGYDAKTGMTLEGGNINTWAGSNIDGWWCSDANWCGSNISADGGSYSFHYLIQTKDPKHVNNDGWIGGYYGFGIMAPGAVISTTSNATGGIQVDKQTTLKFNLGQNAEWFSTSTKDVKITLVLGHFANNVKDNNKACNVELNTIFTPKSAAVQKYDLQLASFTNVGQGCGLDKLDPATELATYPIVTIKFEAANANISVLSTTATSPTYPTEITLSGAITVQ